MSEDVTFPYALGYVPGRHRAFINDAASGGRIFLHYGSVLIALTASEPFQWTPADGIRAPASPPREGDSEFRVNSRNCAVAIETAPPSEFPGNDPASQLAGFRKVIMERSALSFTGRSPASGAYRNRFGNILECTFDGVDRVNGVTVDYKMWPSSKSPWTTQKTPDGPLEIHDQDSKRTYDFSHWKINTSTL
jgi:hypothetical protein